MTDTPDFMHVVAAAKAAGDPNRLALAIPYVRFMGITLEHERGELLGCMTYAPSLVGNPTLPALHGGTLGALMECTAVFELMWSSELSALPKIINITVDYLRSGKPRDTFARAEVRKLGRRVAAVHVSAWQEDRDDPIATANCHFLVAPRAP
jgi:uncharacterized protein (TIGR00369 family)